MELIGAQSLRRSRRLAAALLILLVFSASAHADKGKKFFKEGRRAEQRSDFDAAMLLYEKAAAAQPGDTQYRMSARRMRFQAAMNHVDRGHKLRNAGNLPEALKEFERAFAIDPSNTIAEQELRRTMAAIEAQKAGAEAPAAPPAPTAREQAEAAAQERLAQVEGPVELTPPSLAPITIHASNDVKVLYETIGKLAGINVLFDPDLQSRRITLDLNNVTLEQALDHLATLSRTFWKPVTSNTILVYQEARRRDLEPQVLKTFYLSNTIQPQELTEITQMLRNLLEMTRVAQINSQNAILVRDTPDKVAIAEKILNDIDKSKPEVVIDVSVMQVRRDRSREIGLFPGSPGIQIPVAFSPGGAATTTTTGTGSTATTTTATRTIPLSRIGRLSSGDFSVVVPGATLNLLLSDGRARLLQNPVVRASDGQPAKLRIGERIPIATGSFQPGIGGVGINPLVNTQFQYTDVGVILEITPKVHAEREISLKLTVEISAVTSRVNIGGIDQPVIGQRRIEEEIRLREGEMNILGGIIENQLTTSMSGIPGVSQIPLLKYLFSSTRQEVAENEVLIMLTPHIVRLPQITALNLKGIDIGTATNMQVRTRAAVQAPPLPAQPPAPAGAPAATPGAPALTAPGTPPSPPPGAPPTAPVQRPSPDTGAPPLNPPPVGAPGAPPPTAPLTTRPMEPGQLPKEAPPAPTPEKPAEGEPQPQQPALLRFDSTLYSQVAGRPLPVDILIDNARNLHSIPFQLHYDPRQLKLVSIIHGDLLGRDGQAVAVVQRVDEESGTATISLTRPPGAPGMNGSGVLATVTFQTIASGNSTLTILRTVARDPAQQPLQVSGAQARVAVK